MKKILLLFALTIFFGILNIATSYAYSPPIYDETYNNNQGALYANGTPITVSEENGKRHGGWNKRIFPGLNTLWRNGKFNAETGKVPAERKHILRKE